MIKITNAETGKKVTIHRDVCTTHPQWVHDQIGTKSESELQQFLDGYNTEDYYTADGSHKGPDDLGIELFRDE